MRVASWASLSIVSASGCGKGSIHQCSRQGVMGELNSTSAPNGPAVFKDSTIAEMAADLNVDDSLAWDPGEVAPAIPQPEKR
ncbi:hypothetical protein N8612_05315 [Verrucomicrobia bacterium]|nr:hypothetical protein [Verrucomicrobiota bacterium]